MPLSLAGSSSSSMEEDAVQVNLVTSIHEHADEQSLSLELSDVYDVFGDPKIFPRVGEQYQVEIPPLTSKSDHSRFQRKKPKTEGTAGSLNKYLVGLPIPIIWIKDEVESNKHDPLKNECKFIGVANKIESSRGECIKGTQIVMDCKKLNPNLEAIDSTLVNGVHLGELENSNAHQGTKIGVHEKLRDGGDCLVPGSASDTWNEIEEASFILGLYTFGKNLDQVKRFIGNKKMGDVLSFYYGRFYKSEKYQRWSGCRKIRSRKCIFGQKIFTGPRQQELLSRLLPNVSEECRSRLLEVSKTFVEGKILLEDYVSILKASVGLKALVEGVGVGKGKEDLTGLTADSVKPTQTLPGRPEIPVGKACSMLTHSEIISFLTGNFRLSKAKTSDLFWEAVWPRLLARGWHSEQPGGSNYVFASKNPLVFLVPGVKKYSRKLVKGNHYYDSVSDVLGKVASDPELIELEAVADNDCASKEGNGCTKDTKLDDENSPDRPRHCYLKVKTPNRIADGMKFTVVDTSLASEKMTKVRELRSLPFGVSKSSSFESDSDDENTSEEETNEPESVNTTCYDRGKNDFPKASKCNIGKAVSSNLHDLENKPSKEEFPRSNGGSNNLSTNSIGQKTDLLSIKVRKDGMKCQPLQKMVSNNKNDLVPVTKRRRRVASCSRDKKISNTADFFVVPRVKQEEIPTRVKQEISLCPDLDNSKYSENATANFFVAPRVKQEKASYFPYNSKCSEKGLSREVPSQENKKLADPLPNPSLIANREAVPDTRSFATKDQHEKPQPRTMIDLNLPVSPEVDADEPLVNEVSGIQKSNTSKESDELKGGINSKPVDNSEHQADRHARRQGTRNRPPTTKVLEAFAFGYFDKKEKRKSKDIQDSSVSRPSRRKCRKVVEGSTSDCAGFEKEETRNVCNANDNGNGTDNSDVVHTDFKCNDG